MVDRRRFGYLVVNNRILLLFGNFAYSSLSHPAKRVFRRIEMLAFMLTEMTEADFST